MNRKIQFTDKEYKKKFVCSLPAKNGGTSPCSAEQRIKTGHKSGDITTSPEFKAQKRCAARENDEGSETHVRCMKSNRTSMHETRTHAF